MVALLKRLVLWAVLIIVLPWLLSWATQNFIAPQLPNPELRYKVVSVTMGVQNFYSQGISRMMNSQKPAGTETTTETATSASAAVEKVTADTASTLKEIGSGTKTILAVPNLEYALGLVIALIAVIWGLIKGPGKSVAAATTFVTGKGILNVLTLAGAGMAGWFFLKDSSTATMDLMPIIFLAGVGVLLIVVVIPRAIGLLISMIEPIVTIALFGAVGAFLVGAAGKWLSMDFGKGITFQTPWAFVNTGINFLSTAIIAGTDMANHNPMSSNTALMLGCLAIVAVIYFGKKLSPARR